MKKSSGSSLELLQALFSALGDTTRLRLLSLLGDDEVCVCFFVETLELPQPTISRHLAYLRKAGLVADRRDGKWIHYRVTPPTESPLREVFDTTILAIASDPAVQRDRRRLDTACCSTRVPEILRRAPKPAAAV